ncbi:hypothetical protein BN1002_03712 [Bacillus sp. B-jedd]|nr:hypothetical protein [Bacillus sp. B-jedd]CEG28789.1 hypothetical protein BN1002_03712 [Bacillus sp. B-jedd]
MSIGISKFIFLLFWAGVLFVLYLVISKAVRDGINKSVVGQYFEGKVEVKEMKKSFLDSDLDNNR